MSRGGSGAISAVEREDLDVSRYPIFPLEYIPDAQLRALRELGQVHRFARSGDSRVRIGLDHVLEPGAIAHGNPVRAHSLKQTDQLVVSYFVRNFVRGNVMAILLGCSAWLRSLVALHLGDALFHLRTRFARSVSDLLGVLMDLALDLSLLPTNLPHPVLGLRGVRTRRVARIHLRAAAARKFSKPQNHQRSE